jgi:hypothetical protein
LEVINFLNQQFFKDGNYFVLLVIAMIGILLEKSADKRGKRMVIYSILVFAFIIWNPVVAPVGLKFFGDDWYAYLRIYYLIPLMPILAYAGTKWYTQNVAISSSRKKKCAFAGVLLITIVFAGKLYDSSLFQEASNIYKIDQNALEISNMINQDSGNAVVSAYVSYKDEIRYGIRQYAGNILIEGDADEICKINDLEAITDCSYIALSIDNDLISDMERQGFAEIGKTEDYVVFRKLES